MKNIFLMVIVLCSITTVLFAENIIEVRGKIKEIDSSKSPIVVVMVDNNKREHKFIVDNPLLAISRKFKAIKNGDAVVIDYRESSRSIKRILENNSSKTDQADPPQIREIFIK